MTEKYISFVRKAIIENGPSKGSALMTLLEENYKVEITPQQFHKIDQKLMDYKEIGKYAFYTYNIYYDQRNETQKKVLQIISKDKFVRRRVKIIKDHWDKMFDTLTEKDSFTEEGKRTFATLFKKVIPLLSIDCTGLSHDTVVFTTSFLYVKKRIFLNVNSNPDVEQLKPWLEVYESLLDYKKNVSSKQHERIAQKILSLPEFCAEEDRLKIIRCPNVLIRMQFLLFKFDLTEKVRQIILRFIKHALGEGYNMGGREPKGILAAIVYLLAKVLNKNMTQEDVATTLDISSVTLRSNAKYLRPYLEGFEVS
ncbi:MAG: hypothetical protein GF353_10765 [Candidatus Lokiarchaeota archaeon]|nr:hypothetical protein [Candidatus Lokiarchaeota archaeon]